MNIILIGLLVLSLSLSGLLFFRMNKHLQHTHNYFLGQQEQQQKKQDEELRILSALYEKRVEEKLSELTSIHTNQLGSMLSELNSTVKKSLHSYLIQEEKETKEWLDIIKKEKNHARAIQQLESALNKFPGSYDLIQAYTKRITPFLESSEHTVQKVSLERYNRATRVFLDNCQPSMWTAANELHANALSLGNLYMKNQVTQFKIHAENTIRELELIVTNKVLTNKQLERVEVLDSELQKDILKNFKELNTRYTKVTQRLFTHLSPDANQQEIQKYNLKAVKQFKKAQELFANQEVHFKQGNDLYQLADLLGSWDHAYLTSATQLYFQNVYSDIFAKLSPENKPEMTKLMLTTDKQKVIA